MSPHGFYQTDLFTKCHENSNNNNAALGLFTGAPPTSYQNVLLPHADLCQCQSRTVSWSISWSISMLSYFEKHISINQRNRDNCGCSFKCMNNTEIKIVFRTKNMLWTHSCNIMPKGGHWKNCGNPANTVYLPNASCMLDHRLSICCLYVGPPSATLAQHKGNIGSMCLIAALYAWK